MANSWDKGGDTLTKKKINVSEPRKYRVLLINDHYTTQDFVVLILEQVFNKNPDEAKSLMLDVHTKGSAQVGIYPKEVAEMKVAIVHHVARQNQFPLKCHMEPV
ncbi:MAG TPA: ATP-dependent Clp protease adaptor ClpS [Oligoflexia bacterium]|nr:ATP-dependent Clp protease adaptor ClpS [Oligoflexia bacterium]HMP47996.1 ATP-dependent Clp protease adaptor ClpS [Oligoflexia bacterium]